MFLGLCAVVILAAVPLTGGSLRRLAELRFRWVPLAIAALALQVLVISVWPTMPHSLAVGGHLASYAMLAAVVWVNRRIPGMALIGLGAGANALAIVINGGTLPASASALRATGITLHHGFQNSGVLAHPHLAWLGDTMVSPSFLPLRNMISVGDIVLLAGAAVLVFWASHRPASRVAPRGDGAAESHVRTPGLQVPARFVRRERGMAPELVGQTRELGTVERSRRTRERQCLAERPSAVLGGMIAAEQRRPDVQTVAQGGLAPTGTGDQLGA
ncbi:MAG TPA: DUF5317 domain-containing protein [Mycobacteriales bacterium]|nr:DUF5317 domain-containing protein [Mycobacteriales bacterium]